MKKCPECDRTYDDIQSFCTVDGSTLSAPYDPAATLLLHGQKAKEKKGRKINLGIGTVILLAFISFVIYLLFIGKDKGANQNITVGTATKTTPTLAQGTTPTSVSSPTPVLTPSLSSQQKGELNQDDFWGEIALKDGRTVNYTWLRTSGYEMEKIPYSRTLSYQDFYGSYEKFDLTKVSRIDFLSEQSGFDLGRKEVPESAKFNNWIYKANITFLDGTQWSNIYIYGSGWIWKNDKLEGEVRNAKSITINVRQ